MQGAAVPIAQVEARVGRVEAKLFRPYVLPSSTRSQVSLLPPNSGAVFFSVKLSVQVEGLRYTLP